MTDPLVERVAQALRDEWFESEASDDFRGLARAAIAAIREAEPLTSTPEPSTTETDGEAAISQDPPPGFEWEYRAVEQMEDTMNGGWYDPNGWGWTSEHDAHADALLIEGACVKERVRVWLERRLVGKPERMGD